uniref:RNA methyltransferase n=1 Tax=Panagrellus redivivus TaxID=6233 RepID=A0A7E4ZV65_PANRE
MADLPGPSTAPNRGIKRRPANSNHLPQKRLRCGPNSFLVVGSKHDPLNLESCDPDFADDEDGELGLDPTDPLGLNCKKKKRRHHKRDEEIANKELCSPVFVSQRRFSIVQARKKQQYQHHQQQQAAAAIAAASSTSFDHPDGTESATTSISSAPKVKSDKARQNAIRYRFGNYNRYYGTKPQLGIVDYRLNYLCRDMFEEKNVLDVGCNSGLLTISIAREFLPTRIVGIDLDPHLIRAAKQNIQYFCDRDLKVATRFPTSFQHCFGPISGPAKSKSPVFPENIEFLNENYVFEKDSDLDNVKPEYHTILLLATAKWIHLNNGDDGLKRAFKRIYKQLLPSGRLMIDVLPFESYQNTAKRCNLLQTNCEKIAFRPENFCEYLLSEEIGFRDCADVGVGFAGFNGPLYMFFKN